MTQQERRPWYEIITSKMNQLSEEFGLDPISTQKLTDTVMEIARAQYNVGNKSGIGWMRRKFAEKNSATAGV